MPPGKKGMSSASASGVVDPRLLNPHSASANPFTGKMFGTIAHLPLRSGPISDNRQAIDILLKMSPKNILQLIGSTYGGAIRDLIEPVGADEQCKRAGVQFKSGETRCWICGCLIGSKEEKACEHVIPALRAVMLKGLITNQIITNGIYDAAASQAYYDSITISNYLWAHANCNGSAGKGSIILIDINEAQTEFVADLVNCAKLEANLRTIRKNCYDGNKRSFGGPYNTPFEAYVAEATRQCVSINAEFVAFGRSLPTYAQYAINRIKLYMTALGLESLLTPEEMENNDREKRNQVTNKKKELEALLAKDIKLAEIYLTGYLNDPTVQSTLDSSPERMLLYYAQAVDLYLNYSNLDSANGGIYADQIIGIIKANIATLFQQIPIYVALPLVNVLTHIAVFNTPSGHHNLLNTDQFLDTPTRRRIINGIGNSNVSKLNFTLKNLYMNPDGTPDNNKFGAYVCDYLSLFFTSLALHNFRITGTGRDIQKVDVATSLNSVVADLDISNLAQYPDYIEPSCVESFKWFVPLRELILQLNYDIGNCSELIKQAMIARFTNPGVLLEPNKSNYTPKQLQLVSFFEKGVPTGFITELKKRLPQDRNRKAALKVLTEVLMKAYPNSQIPNTTDSDMAAFLYNHYDTQYPRDEGADLEDDEGADLEDDEGEDKGEGSYDDGAEGGKKNKQIRIIKKKHNERPKRTIIKNRSLKKKNKTVRKKRTNQKKQKEYNNKRRRTVKV
jgi:hypothetical protein